LAAITRGSVMTASTRRDPPGRARGPSASGPRGWQRTLLRL